jgi:hypothetical protein
MLLFYHWYDIETSQDGGNVKISTDGGSTWTLIFPVEGYPGIATWDNVGIPDQPCYTSSSAGWQLAAFILPVTNGQVFKIRWHFGSDGVVVKPGWYVDDVMGIGFYGLNHDVTAQEILSPTGTINSGTIITPTVVVENWGGFDETFPVVFTIPAVGYYATQNVTIPLGVIDTIEFAPWTAVIGTFDAISFTMLGNDNDLSNDTAYCSFEVVVNDVGVTQILAPLGTILPGTVVTPSAVVENFGNSTETFPVAFNFNGYSSTKTVSNLPSGSTITVEFDPWTAVLGTYNTTAFTQLTGDVVPSNDTAYGSFIVIPPIPLPWEGKVFSPGYWKNHPDSFARYLPVTIAGVTVSEVKQALSILSNPSARDAWKSFLAHFLTTKFNTCYDPALLNAFYNDTARTGEFMENQPVGSIIIVADNYRQTTPRETLLLMKDVFDAINNYPRSPVLWLGPFAGQDYTSNTDDVQGYTTEIPISFNLSKPCPNPTHKTLSLRFGIPNKSRVNLAVYDINGRMVKNLISETKAPGYYRINTDCGGLSSGVYILRMKADKFEAIEKFVVTK